MRCTNTVTSGWFDGFLPSKANVSVSWMDQWTTLPSDHRTIEIRSILQFKLAGWREIKWHLNCSGKCLFSDLGHRNKLQKASTQNKDCDDPPETSCRWGIFPKVSVISNGSQRKEKLSGLANYSIISTLAFWFFMVPVWKKHLPETGRPPDQLLQSIWGTPTVDPYHQQNASIIPQSYT